LNKKYAEAHNTLLGITSCYLTDYRLDSQGIESQWAKIFHPCPDQPSGPPSLLYIEYRVSFLGVKQLEHGVDHPHPPGTKGKERVELYLYSPSGISLPVLG